MQDVKQSYDWDATVAGFDGADWPAVTNAFFAQVDCQVTLVLRPVDTTGPPIRPVFPPPRWTIRTR